jgi:hypothetical protein
VVYILKFKVSTSNFSKQTKRLSILITSTTIYISNHRKFQPIFNYTTFNKKANTPEVLPHRAPNFVGRDYEISRWDPT